MRAPPAALARKRGRVEAVQAAALDADGWSRLFDDPVLGPRLLPIGLLGGDDGQLAPGDAERLAQGEHRDELNRSIPDAALALAGRVR